MTDNQLDTLFSQLKLEAPGVSFEETQKSVLAKIIAASGGMLGTYSLFKLLTLKKWIIMISLFSAALTGTIIGFVYLPVSEPSTLNPMQTTGFLEQELRTHDQIPLIQDKIPEDFTEEGEVTISSAPKMERKREFEYIISSSTKEDFLIQMQKDAREVGIIMEYETVMVDSTMESMDVRMKLLNEDNEVTSNILTIMEFKDNSGIYSIHWKLNDKGRAIAIQSRCNSSVDLSLDHLVRQQNELQERSIALEKLVSGESKLNERTQRLIMDLEMEMISIAAKLDYLYNEDLQNAVKNQKRLSNDFEKQFGTK